MKTKNLVAVAVLSLSATLSHAQFLSQQIINNSAEIADGSRAFPGMVHQRDRHELSAHNCMDWSNPLSRTAACNYFLANPGIRQADVPRRLLKAAGLTP